MNLSQMFALNADHFVKIARILGSILVGGLIMPPIDACGTPSAPLAFSLR